MNLKDLAKAFPRPIEQVLRYIYGAIPPRITYGNVFWDTYNFLQESQWWSREKLQEYQMEQLSKLLHHSYKNVPYYRRTFDERGLKPKDIQDFDDLRKLPFITKEIMRDNLCNFIAQNIPKSKLMYVTTGGSTGIPFGFYERRGFSNEREKAFILTMWKRVGFNIGDKSAVFRGGYTGNPSKGEFWKYSPTSKELSFSCYHMSPNFLETYLNELRNFKPAYIQAYPSAILVFARFVLENNISELPSIKAILAGSENLYPPQRKLVEKAFKCKVFSWYGHTEKAALAGECEYSTHYHLFPEYGYPELIGNNGNEVTKDGEIGEIVATGFNNFATPFIRYKTMDLGIFSSKKCQCGRQYQLLERIEGRLQELIVTDTGRLIPMTALNMHSRVFDNVKQFQFCQDKKGRVILNVVKKNTYTKKDTEYIRRELYKKLRDDMKLEIQFLDYIPRTRSGKYRFLIQKLPIEWGD